MASIQETENDLLSSDDSGPVISRKIRKRALSSSESDIDSSDDSNIDSDAAASEKLTPPISRRSKRKRIAHETPRSNAFAAYRESVLKKRNLQASKLTAQDCFAPVASHKAVKNLMQDFLSGENEESDIDSLLQTLRYDSTNPANLSNEEILREFCIFESGCANGERCPCGARVNLHIFGIWNQEIDLLKRDQSRHQVCKMFLQYTVSYFAYLQALFFQALHVQRGCRKPPLCLIAFCMA